MPETRVWTTAMEVEHIDGLASGKWWVNTPNYNGETGAQMLRRYLTACRARVDWGSIDKEAVMRHARKLLSAL